MQVSSVVDEFRVLGDTFEQMRTQIRDHVVKLQAANQALDAKVFHLSLRNLINQVIINKNEETLFQDMLEILANAFGARRCSMWLLDARREKLVMKIAVGASSGGAVAGSAKTPPSSAGHDGPPPSSDGPEADGESSAESVDAAVGGGQTTASAVGEELPGSPATIEASGLPADVEDVSPPETGHEGSAEAGAASSASVEFFVGEGIAGFVAETGRPAVVNDPAAEPRFKQFLAAGCDRPVKNLLTVPLQGDKEILGVINVADRDGDFTDDDALLLQDIAAQVAIALQKAQLFELAITDGLTGLFVHRYFQIRLEAELVRAARAEEPVALIMFDIDHFKSFNDTYGHQIGDEVIRLVSRLIRRNVRVGIDIPARYGGEEFALIMPNTDLDGAFILAERLRNEIAEARVPHEGNELQVTISLGCAMFPEHADAKDALIRQADSALYASKEGGRNCTTRASGFLKGDSP